MIRSDESNSHPSCRRLPKLKVRHIPIHPGSRCRRNSALRTRRSPRIPSLRTPFRARTRPRLGCKTWQPAKRLARCLGLPVSTRMSAQEVARGRLRQRRGARCASCSPSSVSVARRGVPGVLRGSSSPSQARKTWTDAMFALSASARASNVGLYGDASTGCALCFKVQCSIERATSQRPWRQIWNTSFKEALGCHLPVAVDVIELMS